jgi:hypothetical protein
MGKTECSLSIQNQISTFCLPVNMSFPFFTPAGKPNILSYYWCHCFAKKYDTTARDIRETLCLVVSRLFLAVEWCLSSVAIEFFACKRCFIWMLGVQMSSGSHSTLHPTLSSHGESTVQQPPAYRTSVFL